jgi:hypothetical protein
MLFVIVCNYFRGGEIQLSPLEEKLTTGEKFNVESENAVKTRFSFCILTSFLGRLFTNRKSEKLSIFIIPGK